MKKINIIKIVGKKVFASIERTEMMKEQKEQVNIDKQNMLKRFIDENPNVFKKIVTYFFKKRYEREYTKYNQIQISKYDVKNLAKEIFQHGYSHPIITDMNDWLKNVDSEERELKAIKTRIFVENLSGMFIGVLPEKENHFKH